MIYIIIPVFNRWHFTQLCLKSLHEQNYHNYKIVVIDHGSADGTSEKIASHFPEVIILKGDESMWWTAATNLGITYAINKCADFVLTLNNDTIAEPNYLSELISCSKKKSDNALIGSTAIDADTNQIVFAGDNENWFLETSVFNHKNKLLMSQDCVSCSRFPGRGLLIPIGVFSKIGLFDEINFPHYGSDYEFTQRAIKNNVLIYCAISAKIKIFPKESEAFKLLKEKNIYTYYQHLFGIRGGAQLKIFYKYAFRYCPWYALPSFLFLGTIRRIFGYWIK